MLGCDMICNLYTLPRSYELPDGIRIKRVFAGDMPEVLGFVRDTSYEGWVSEAQKAIFASKCFVATKAATWSVLLVLTPRRLAILDRSAWINRFAEWVLVVRCCSRRSILCVQLAMVMPSLVG